MVFKKIKINHHFQHNYPADILSATNPNAGISIENQVLPTVHAAGDCTVCSSSWAHGCDNIIVVVLGEAVHQQALVLGHLPELQGACIGTRPINKEFRHTQICRQVEGRLTGLPPLTRVRCNHDTLVWHPLYVSYSCRSLHARLAEFLIGRLGGVTVDPDRTEPAPATQAGGTEQQRAIWSGNTKKNEINK